MRDSIVVLYLKMFSTTYDIDFYLQALGREGNKHKENSLEDVERLSTSSRKHPWKIILNKTYRRDVKM